jgi:hypothetical protein
MGIINIEVGGFKMSNLNAGLQIKDEFDNDFQ